MEYVLTVNSLRKKYRNFTALDNVTMHVPKGAVYGFVGENGAGKTTLIRLICGLQKPDAGDYSLFGLSFQNPQIGKSRSRMGAVVETPSIYLEMSAADNLKEQYRLLGIPSFASIPELLKLVGLEDTGRKKAKNFSLGMRQRLGIALALVGNPDFLVLDEPVNGLDPQGIIEIRELILKLNTESGITILISSHILEELSKLATHYGFIHKGKLIQEISAAQLEASCRRSLCVTVSDSSAVAVAMEERGLEYQILSDTQAEIYDEITITELVDALSPKECVVYSVSAREEGLENYYMNLITPKRK
ncbi:MAG: ATP-binding cassette domain-containing protein [Eubacterium sp.]|nr:ATP-binding cassette domain-containing protein [Eubacterium sp.]MCM1304673.1 ATP-binding cassette domain-containing protein [Butyrivibrio sp.]MCM1343258.1 ATP-binding cassette domain-containing protein [Muribaculaceae bacterium]MCM1412433.1 ATP-binding cassette domain-containing protein [Lachnospiraceae bacterium]